MLCCNVMYMIVYMIVRKTRLYIKKLSLMCVMTYKGVLYNINCSTFIWGKNVMLHVDTVKYSLHKFG